MSVCNACNVRLPDEDSLKQHYRSDFHAANLKRRTQDMAPTPYREYTAAKAAEAEAAAAAAAAAAPCIYVCDACGKAFASAGQMEAHTQSKRHAARVREILRERREAAAAAAAAATAAAAADGGADAAIPADDGDADAGAGSAGGLAGDGAAAPTADDGNGDDDDDDDEEEEEELVVTCRNCVFCFAEFRDVEANLRHMRVAHSFYVPDLEALVDPEGLVTFLIAKVVAGACVFCDGPKTYESAEAAQQHMAAKGHCRMRYDEPAHFEAFAEFYDYAGEDTGDEGGGALVVAAASSPAALTPAGDLALASGGVARHRDLVKYYRQRFRAPDERLSVQLNRLALEYSAAGQPTRSGARVAATGGANTGSGVRGNRVDKRAQRRDGDYWSHLQLHTGILMNDIRRKHFRVAATGEGH